jgi:hypothetical protein
VFRHLDVRKIERVLRSRGTARRAFRSHVSEVKRVLRLGFATQSPSRPIDLLIHTVFQNVVFCVEKYRPLLFLQSWYCFPIQWY